MAYLNIYTTNISMFLALFPDEKYIYYMFIFIVIVVSYFIIHPIIYWIITLKTTKLLTYFVSSLLVLLFLCMIIIVSGESRFTIHDLLKMALQSLSVFGLAIILYSVFLSFLKKIGIKK